MSRFIRLIAVCMFICSAAVATAQDSSTVYINRGGATGPMDWLFGRQGRSPAKVIRVPQAQRAGRTYQPRRRSSPVHRPVQESVVPASPSVQPDNPAAAPAPEAADNGVAPQLPTNPSQQVEQSLPAAIPAPVMPAVNVAVIGDSLSVFLAQGLQETYADQASVTFTKRNREASGLVRDDYFDWPKQLRELLAGARFEVIVLQIGSNDRQQLRDGDSVFEPLTDRWRELYAKRIDEIIAIARDKKVPMIWVGLPPMRGARYSNDVMALNAAYKARAAAAGIPYVDIWEAFAGEDGSYVVNGPDVDGTIVRLRTADGVHFTRAGSRKLAFFADKELKKAIDAARGKVPAAAPVLASVNRLQPIPLEPLPALPEPTLPAALRSIDSLLGIPAPDQPLLTQLVPRPAQGPVVSLNIAPVSAGGQLVDIRSRPATTLSAPVVDNLRARRVGRADDFRFSQ